MRGRMPRGRPPFQRTAEDAICSSTRETGSWSNVRLSDSCNTVRKEAFGWEFVDRDATE